MAGIERVEKLKAAEQEQFNKSAEIHQKLIDELKAQSDFQLRVAAQLRQQAADTLTQRLKNTQNALEIAKANFTKEASSSNKSIVEVLEMQLDQITRQVKEAASK